MNVLFIEPRLKQQYLSVAILSSVLKKYGHKCNILYSKDRIQINKGIQQIKPDLIALSCDTYYKNIVLKTAQQIKKEYRKIPIILGGHHPTFRPEIIYEEGIDIICRGEGEEAIVELAQKIEQSKNITKIKNLWVKKDGKIYKNPLRSLIKNLDTLPFLDRTILNQKIIIDEIPHYRTRALFQGQRGCIHNCSYCSNHVLKELYKDRGNYTRVRSVKNLIDEIKTVIKKEKITIISFNDDSFNNNKEWLLRFCKAYKKEIDIPFLCGTHPGNMDEENIINLKKANCVGIRVGIETGNEKLRMNLLNKKIPNKEIIKFASLLKKYKIPLFASVMYGYHKEQEEDIINTIRLLIQTKAFGYFLKLNLLPETELEKYYSKKKIKINDDLEIYNLVMLTPLLSKFPILLPLLKLAKYKVPFLKLFMKISEKIYQLDKNKFSKIKYNSFREKIYSVIRYNKSFSYTHFENES